MQQNDEHAAMSMGFANPFTSNWRVKFQIRSRTLRLSESLDVRRTVRRSRRLIREPVLDPSVVHVSRPDAGNIDQL